MIWVVNTNSNTCHIYHFQKKPLSLQLIKELSHLENKLKNVELTSDKPGHFQTTRTARTIYSPRQEMKEIEINNFARDIARELEKGRNDHNYNELILIAAPHMSGLILEHLNPHVKGLVINNIQKDFQDISEKDLLAYLHTHAQYHDAQH